MMFCRTSNSFLSALALCVGLLIVLPLRAEPVQTVRVLGYVFPPFVNADTRTGLTLDLIELLNQHQQRFQFSFQLTTPNRRYVSFERKQADMVLFEMPEWGWKERSIKPVASSVLLQDGERYISRAQPDRDQQFFDQIGNKRIAIFQGYHYGFAGFNTDGRWLNQHFNVLITDKHEQLISLVTRERVDVSVITQAYLRSQIKQNPELAETLLISDRFDQIYQLRALIAATAPITPNQFEQMVSELVANGSYKRLLAQYGIAEPPH